MARKAETSRATTEKDPNFEPPQWVIILVVAAVAIVVVIFSLPDSWLESLPYGDSDYFYVALIALPMVVMIAAVVANKLLLARRASTWVAVPGRIASSEIVARAHQFAGETSEIRNFPSIGYSFTVNGVACKGTRISIGDDTAGANTEATMKRYPKGADVTVYYDPANPKNCFLERDMPKDLTKGCLAIIGITVAAGALLYWVISSGVNVLAGVVEPGQEGVVLFACLFGVALLLGFFSVRSTSKAADGWPVVPGKIVVSEVEKFKDMNEGRTRIYYAPFVEYAYKVNGLEYHGKKIKVSVTTSGDQPAAEKIAARYPLDANVGVHYDPANPENAALESTGNMAYVLLLMAAFCFVVAIYASGIFKS